MTSQALREFDSIYNDTFNEIKRYVILKCRNIADVEDILQNIYTDAYKKLKKNTRKEVIIYGCYYFKL